MSLSTLQMRRLRSGGTGVASQGHATRTCQSPHRNRADVTCPCCPVAFLPTSKDELGSFPCKGHRA